MNKLFIIGLPRTGTTSVSAALLDHYRVAHTAYTKRAFELADVISDCPCFSDYPQLDKIFPNSKFVYLQRSLNQWLPSIQMLLQKMAPNFSGETYVSPVQLRSFNQVFSATDQKQRIDLDHLKTCYQNHQNQVDDYFKHRSDLLKLDVSSPNAQNELFEFVGIERQKAGEFPHLNIGKRVDSWKEIKHVNKVNPNAAGTEHRRFFEY